MENIKLLCINGSARIGGNSRFMMEKAVEFAKETSSGTVQIEMYETGGRVYKPCDACDLCHTKLGYCKIIDDDYIE